MEHLLKWKTSIFMLFMSWWRSAINGVNDWTGPFIWCHFVHKINSSKNVHFLLFLYSAGNHYGGYNTVTLGRKTSTLSWAGGSPSRSFRSLGRNGTMSLLHTPSSSRRHINDYHNGRSPTPNVSWWA